MSRGPLQQFARAALIGIPLLSAPILPETAPLGMLTLAALIAYDGTAWHAVWRVLAFLLALELVFGFDVGVLTLPYLVGLMLWQGTQRAVSLAPWSHADGWRTADMVRTAVSTALLWAVMTVVSVVVEASIYARGAFAERSMIALGAVPWEILVLYGGVVLVLLRRIDVPFRERIHFGTP